MEKGKQVNKTASSFTSELFGPKDVSKSSSSSGNFGALFGHSSTGLGKDSTHSGITRSMQNHSANGKQDQSYGRGEIKNGSTAGKDPNSYPQNGSREEPCYFNSSIYYGGQEDYSPAAAATAKNPNNNNYQHRKDSGDEDSNANNATRGNWWQGSLYY